IRPTTAHTAFERISRDSNEIRVAALVVTARSWPGAGHPPERRRSCSHLLGRARQWFTACVWNAYRVGHQLDDHASHGEGGQPPHLREHPTPVGVDHHPRRPTTPP